VTVVTDEPVIAALADGRVSAQRAGELGLMRYYGTPDGVQDVKSLMDGLSRTQQSGLPY
jgi:hypothetical protein